MEAPSGRYLRPNRARARPRRIVFLVVAPQWARKETYGDAWKFRRAFTRYVRLDRRRKTPQPDDRVHNSSRHLWAYIDSMARPRSTLWIIGAQIGADLWMTYAYSYLAQFGWEKRFEHDNGETYILVAQRGSERMAICALNNWIPGNRCDWARLFGLNRPDIDLANLKGIPSTQQALSDLSLCQRSFLHYLGLLDVHDAGRFSFTIGSQAMTCFRHRFMSMRPVIYSDDAVREFESDALHMGRAEVIRVGRFTDGPYVYVDVRGMYGSVMADCLYPIEIRQVLTEPSIRSLRRHLDRSLAIAEVKVNTKTRLYPRKVRGRVEYPRGEFEVTLPTATLKRALDLGDIVKVYRAITYRPYPLLRDHARYWEEVKARARDSENPMEMDIAKAMVNALYGKFAQRVPKVIETASCPPLLMEIDEAYNYDLHALRKTRALMGQSVTTLGTELHRNAIVSIAAHITDYARDRLYALLSRIGLERVYYVHTDGWVMAKKHLGAFSDLLEGSGPGSIRVVMEGDELITYRTGDFSLGTLVRAKGRPRSAVPIGVNLWRCETWPGVRSLLQGATPGYYPRDPKSWSRQETIPGSRLMPDGTVIPVILSSPVPKR